MLINAGIHEVIYIEEYEDELASQLFKEANMIVRKINLRRNFGRAASGT
jgi:deoxycytidylate deaminase